MAPIAVVTGGTGFIGTELVKQLLEKGYVVRTTVRDPRNERKTAALRALGKAFPGSLELVGADLLEDGSFDAAVEGSNLVFHVASPFILSVEDAQRDLLDPAVKGTRNLLGAVARASSRPRRVVLTSSMAAVAGAPPKNGVAYTDQDWNETSTVENGQAYRLSKTLAERTAWKLAAEEGIDLVTINPSFVFGPIIDPLATGESRQIFTSIVDGSDAEPFAPGVRFVDVRDVALAHIRAAEIPSASGRYLVTSPAEILWSQVRGWLLEEFPGSAVVPPPAEPQPQPKPTADASRAVEELGIAFRPYRETSIDMARTLLAIRADEPSSA